MRITDTKLRNIIRDELKRKRVYEAKEKVSAGKMNRLRIKVNNDWKKNKNVAKVQGLIYDLKVGDDTKNDLMDYLFSTSAGLAGPSRDTRRTAKAEVPEEAPEKKEKVLVHSPTKDGGPSDPRVATAGHGEEAEVFTLGADGQSISYAAAMKDILAGKKMLKAGQGGDAFKTSEDEAKKTIWRQIKIIQGLLISAGYAKGLFSKPTGYFGPKTKSAVLKMQTALKLARDGIVGRQTAAAFNPKVEGSKVPITGKDVSDAIERVINELPPAKVQKESIRRWRNSRLRRDPSKVRVTRRQLRRAIREEFSSVTEQPTPRPLFDDPIETAKELSKSKDLNSEVLATWQKIYKKEMKLPPYSNEAPEGAIRGEVTVAGNKITSWKAPDDASKSEIADMDKVLEYMKKYRVLEYKRLDIPDGTYAIESISGRG